MRLTRESKKPLILALVTSVLGINLFYIGSLLALVGVSELSLDALSLESGNGIQNQSVNIDKEVSSNVTLSKFKNGTQDQSGVYDAEMKANMTALELTEGTQKQSRFSYVQEPSNVTASESNAGTKNQSTIYYPRPRPTNAFVDCGCPYTCKAIHLDTKNDGHPSNQTCREAVTQGMSTKHRYHGWDAFLGEEFSCIKAVENNLCGPECNPLRCPKPEPLPESDPLVEFTPHEGVVIVTKVMGYPVDREMLLQSFCLLTAAYNSRLNYDIVVFTTLYQPEWQEELRKVTNANVIVVWENNTMAELAERMSNERKRYFVQQCQKSISNLTWDDTCSGIGSLRYNWQAEFRSLHVWTHPALAKYKYMLWMDSDAFCTMPWKSDPVDFLIQNDLVFASLNIQGRGGKPSLQNKIREHFNTTLCNIELINGTLTALTGETCVNRTFPIAHGFFHLSNLDFFRSHVDWLTKFIGEDQLSRNPDDQEAVTVTSTMLAPGRVWDLNSNGIQLNVMHNGLVDGKHKISPSMYKKWWSIYAKRDFEAGYDKCHAYVKHAG